MSLTALAAGWLILAGLGLRATRTLPVRWSTIWGPATAFVGLVLLGGASLTTGTSLLEVYLAGGLGAVAVAGPATVDRALVGTATTALGVGLLATVFGGTPSPLTLDVGVGPLLLVLVVGLGTGVVAGMALRLASSAGAAGSVVVGAGLLVGVGLHVLDGASGSPARSWGIEAALRSGSERLWLLAGDDSLRLMQPLVVHFGSIGLAALTAACVAGGALIWPGARRRLIALALVLTTLTLGWLLLSGLVLDASGGIAQRVEEWMSAGLVVPRPGESLHLDLSSVLPVLAGLAGALGLLDVALATPLSPTDEASGLDLPFGLLGGILILATLQAVWAELWGQPLAAAPGIGMVALTVIGLGLFLGGATRARRAVFGGLVVWVGLIQLPAGALTPIL